MYDFCAETFAYLDSVISMATSERIYGLYFFVYSMVRVNGMSMDICDTMTKLKYITEYNKPRILVRLLLDYFRYRKRYHEFKKGLTHSFESLYHQIEFVG